MALSKQGKFAEAVELVYAEKAVFGVGGADLAPARASTCARAHVRAAHRRGGVAEVHWRQ